MISKKLATALGAGTLGASGAAAWKFGLFGGSQNESVGVARIYSFKASESDKKAVDSDAGLVWSVNVLDGKGQMFVEVKKEGGRDSEWQCGLNIISISGFANKDLEEIEKQGQELKKILEEDDIKKREQFVKNCSVARNAGENEGVSEIDLEAIKDSSSGNKLKFKDFEKIWTEDVKGIERIRGEDKWLLYETGDEYWKLDETKEEREGKITISITSTESVTWKCSVAGSSSDDLSSKKFKEENIKMILKPIPEGDGIEKKRYLIRNCAKNNKEIRGLTVQSTGNNEWEFSNLKRITESMHENPS